MGTAVVGFISGMAFAIASIKVASWHVRRQKWRAASAALCHRDDIPMDTMEQLEAHFAETHPGMKLVCAGDNPDAIPEHVKEHLIQFHEAGRHSLATGTCFECREQMRNYSPMTEGWRPESGWNFMRLGNGKAAFWLCPECGDSDDD